MCGCAISKPASRLTVDIIVRIIGMPARRSEWRTCMTRSQPFGMLTGGAAQKSGGLLGRGGRRVAFAVLFERPEVDGLLSGEVSDARRMRAGDRRAFRAEPSGLAAPGMFFGVPGKKFFFVQDDAVWPPLALQAYSGTEARSSQKPRQHDVA